MAHLNAEIERRILPHDPKGIFLARDVDCLDFTASASHI